MINYDEIFPVGKLEKTHGLNGEISFNFTTDVFDTAEAPFFILEVQGILVPFYIESYRFKTDSTGLLKFEGIDTEEKARELWGHELYLPKTYIDQMDEKEIGLEYFVGFEIHDTSGIIGTITEVDDSTGNALFIIGKADEDVLIPVVDEYITEINHEKRILHMQLPEGLLDL